MFVRSEHTHFQLEAMIDFSHMTMLDSILSNIGNVPIITSSLASFVSICCHRHFHAHLIKVG